jgi:hypothetical protein
MEIPVTAILNMLNSGWRHRVLACCLTLAALALVLPGSRAVAKPIAGGDACDRAYAACLRNSEKCTDPAKCRHRCDVKWTNCLNGKSSTTNLGGGAGGGNGPGGGNYDPSKPGPGKSPVRNYPVSGPIRVFPGGPSNPVSGGNANPVSGTGNSSRKSASSVRLKTSTQYRWQSNQRRRR